MNSTPNIYEEKQILGKMIVDGKWYRYRKQYFLKIHQIISDTIHMMAFTGTGIDLITLTDHLEKVGKLEIIGGAPYLVELLNGEPLDQEDFEYLIDYFNK